MVYSKPKGAPLTRLMMRLARTWRNSIPRNSPRPGSRSKIGSSKSVDWGRGSSVSVQRNCPAATPHSLVERLFDSYPQKSDVELKAVGRLQPGDAQRAGGALGRSAELQRIGDLGQVGDGLEAVLVGRRLGHDEGIDAVRRSRGGQGEVLGLSPGLRIVQRCRQVVRRRPAEEGVERADE